MEREELQQEIARLTRERDQEIALIRQAYSSELKTLSAQLAAKTRSSRFEMWHLASKKACEEIVQGIENSARDNGYVTLNASTPIMLPSGMWKLHLSVINCYGIPHYHLRMYASDAISRATLAKLGYREIPLVTRACKADKHGGYPRERVMQGARRVCQMLTDLESKNAYPKLAELYALP